MILDPLLWPMQNGMVLLVECVKRMNPSKLPTTLSKKEYLKAIVQLPKSVMRAFNFSSIAFVSAGQGHGLLISGDRR